MAPISTVSTGDSSRAFAQTIASYSLALTFIVIAVFSIPSTAQAQTLSCPANFSLFSEASTTYICRFEQTLTTPAVAPQLPTETMEGLQLIVDARTMCSGAGGTTTQAIDILQTGVAVDCRFEKPAPPPTPPRVPTVDDEEEEEEEEVVDVAPARIEFDEQPEFDVPGVESSVASSLANLCNEFLARDDLSAAQQDLLARCQDINAESNTGAQLLAAQQVAAKQYADIANLISFQNTITVGDIGNRLASMRSVMSQNTKDVARTDLSHPSPGLLAAKTPQQRGGAAGDEGWFDRLGIFVLGAKGDGEKDTTARSRGFDYDSSSLTLGIDYLVNNSTIVGVAYGYGSSDSRLFDSTDSIDIQTDNVSLYGSKYFKNGWYLDAIAGIGSVDTTNKRKISFVANGVAIDQDALGQFDSGQSIYSFGVGRGFETLVDWDFSARLNYIETSVDRFSESTNSGADGFGLALEIDDHNVRSLTSEISLGVSKPLSQSWGVLVPSATLKWSHEFERGDEVLFGRFLADPVGFDFQNSGIALGRDNTGSTIFTVPLEQVDSDYGNMVLGVTALLPNQLTANFNYNRSIGLKNFNHAYYSLTLRRDFQ